MGQWEKEYFNNEATCIKVNWEGRGGKDLQTSLVLGACYSIYSYSVDCLFYKVALHYCSLSFTLNVTDYILQPGDDIVFMAQELEKVFMQKIAQMPPEESLVILNKGKRKGKKPEGKACIIC